MYRIYFNLHKHVFSIQHKIPGKGWRLWKHTNNLIAEGCTFKVYESRRQKVLRERQKNVHAYIICEKITENCNLDNNFCVYNNRISYNPYKFPNFYNKTTEEKIDSVQKIYLNNGKLHILRSDGKEYESKDSTFEGNNHTS